MESFSVDAAAYLGKRGGYLVVAVGGHLSLMAVIAQPQLCLQSSISL